MTINTRRLEVLEATQRARDEAERHAAIAALDSWLESNTSEAERAAWTRFLLNLPCDADQLRRIGMTQAEADAIVAEVGPCTAEDLLLVDALDQRLPNDLAARLNAINA